jgi:hypothetical protein
VERCRRRLNRAAFESPRPPAGRPMPSCTSRGTSRAVSDRATAKTPRGVDDYRMGLVPVAVPLALLSRHLRAAGTDWARSQTYLQPYPKELGLRGLISKPRRARAAAPTERPKSPSRPGNDRP